MGAMPFLTKVLTLGMFDPAGDKAAEDARNEQRALLARQAAKAEKLRIETLQQPKRISSDNFLSNKASQLAKLRLGMSSTITGAGNTTPSLIPSTNTAAKTKLGL